MNALPANPWVERYGGGSRDPVEVDWYIEQDFKAGEEHESKESS